ncbi:MULTISPECIES: Ada metal-binding domain-containing protein [unclassified Shewanella]|uniref:Ada metal-binding domain-containing protein n=1 Tax=unclassified Shewanella TaxID=196818 RepID=UPI000C82A27B|nr:MULTISPECIES: Ada metal-binding domain-containing protein [unclassified Shewanella]MDO6619518.1 AlkA N-terminal domain-containing protein [Shewanella sp. 6_MG-2023]MDO6775813.1 AlkA N-terminal domain-containing protein [Shewanella sp. 3_MG-2023]PMG29831.1 alcohol dehydrogenase [Shewanella sp. 10N.286.52.C2]PMH85830.1 alcohol dehydrogenase [Shewanella sp. 10N.286.48.B5]PMI03523.1 alcohol dehydrogenase [Shewanella sp. 10N.286.48.A6]
MSPKAVLNSEKSLAPIASSQACSLAANVCRQARLSRDARFDGHFFTGVLTTGIYCRSICPATAPKEQNVRYFDSAIKAAQAGLRPCLRCRPDSAPQSNAWKGTQTSLQRAIALIDGGCLSGEQGQTLASLSQRLGISSRYLSQLFNKQLGTSPKKYAIYRQLMFAKQLLHQTSLPITDVALAAGFNSIRRFNEVFKEQLQLTPSQLRRDSAKANVATKADGISLLLDYRPPFNWSKQWSFYQLRSVENMEWLDEASKAYGRSFCLNVNHRQVSGTIDVLPLKDKHQLSLTVKFERADDLDYLHHVVLFVRKLLDLDADMAVIHQSFKSLVDMGLTPTEGLRIPATASVFEAGCRAVLGQQVSVVQASKLLNILVRSYGKKLVISDRELILFPTPQAIAAASLTEFNMPASRKAALNLLGQFVAEHPDASPDDWLSVKGIGPWTIAYAKMRGQGDPDIFLSGDLVIKNRLKVLRCQHGKVDGQTEALTGKAYRQFCDKIAKDVSPWGSYVTFQLWNSNES